MEPLESSDRDAHRSTTCRTAGGSSPASRRRVLGGLLALGSFTACACAGGTGRQAAKVATPVARKLVWADDFDGPAGTFPDRSSWTAELGGGGWGNGELQTYTDDPRNVALDGDGHLVI